MDGTLADSRLECKFITNGGRGSDTSGQTNVKVYEKKAVVADSVKVMIWVSGSFFIKRVELF